MDSFVWDEKSVTAYSLFYLPTNALKLHFLLKLLPSSIIEELRNTTVIDIGTGPGTYLISLILFLKEKGYESLPRMIGVDIEPMMLRQARSLLKDFSIEFFNEFKQTSKVEDKKTYIFGNCLNELTEYEAEKWAHSMDGELLFFIEPGTPREFKKLMKVRDILTKEKNYQILYPCPKGNLPCPILEREDDWCHQVLRETHHPSIERLSQLAHLDRKVMPFIGHVYAKREFESSAISKAHFVRFLRETKFSFEWEVCVNETKDLELYVFEIMKKDLGKQGVKELKAISVGQKFDFLEIKNIGENKKRVKLLKA